MKRILFFIIVVCSMTVHAADIFVTPDSSLVDAVRKAREMRRLGQATEVTIHLAAGTYYLYEPLCLRPEDNGLTIEGPTTTPAIPTTTPDGFPSGSPATTPDGFPSGSPSGSITLTRKWKKGDVIELNLDMRTRLMEANPLVEEAKNEVAVMRGPIVYCLEGQDIEGSHRINDIAIPADTQFREVKMTLEGHEMIALESDVKLINNQAWNNQTLYREVSKDSGKVKIRLIPYYAWDNRGIQDMSLWLPLAR